VPRLTPDELDAFLAEPGHLVRVGTVDADGMPRVVPTWFVRDGDDILFTPRLESVFLANLQRDPRVGLSIDEDPLPYRKLTVQGESRIVHPPGEDDAWRETYRTIARRYVGEAGADAYLEFTIEEPRALVAVSLPASRTSTWRMPAADEDPSGIWAARYFHRG
jgi:PPOX class probable F420-dependent enzyme